MPVFLFPGQGSQKAGTAKQFYEASSEAHSILNRAIPLLSVGVADILFEGSQEDTNNTCNAQPILLCVETAIAAHLVSLGVKPDLCAGHSLGEISALTVAGAIEFEEAIPFVLERARLMSENVPDGGMAAVIGMDSRDIEPLLCEGTQIANFNGPEQTIISGATASLESSIKVLKAQGARRVLSLQVSGPFHSHYMKPAAKILEKRLATMRISSPKIPVLSSVSGAYEEEPEQIRTLLAQQLYSPVLWTVVMEKLSKQNAVEAGPGNTLAGLAKRALNAPVVYPANTPEACESLLEKL